MSGLGGDIAWMKKLTHWRTNALTDKGLSKKLTLSTLFSGELKTDLDVLRLQLFSRYAVGPKQ